MRATPTVPTTPALPARRSLTTLTTLPMLPTLAAVAALLAGCEFPVGLGDPFGGGYGGGTPWTDPEPVTRPVAVAGGHAFVTVDAGFDHTCARDASGTVWCWGVGGVGQLGPGTYGAAEPVAVEWDVALEAVSVDHTVSCAVSGQRLVCWGSAAGLPIRAEDGLREPWPEADVVAVAVGGANFAGEDGRGGVHLCAVGSDARAYCAGANYFGQLGRDTISLEESALAAVAGLEGVAQVTTGYLHACALLLSGEAWCWGGSETGELGNGSAAMERCAHGGLVVPCAPAPVRVDAAVRLRALSAGVGQTCAIDDAGALLCWGRSPDDPWTHTTTPTAVDPAAFGGRAVVAVSVGTSHVCALVDGGEAFCWGTNHQGELGTGDTTPRSTPAPVDTDLRFRSISAGHWYTCAITLDDAAYCWGDDAVGKLGDGV